MKKTIHLALAALLLLGAASCSQKKTPVMDNTAGKPSHYVDPGTSGPVKGVGIESQDIVSMADQMMRDMFTNPVLVGTPGDAPKVIIDAGYFKNESASRVNVNMITDKLRTALNRSAQGRMRFVGRENIAMVEHERELKREGVVSGEGSRMTQATLGADYRLAGRITSLNAFDPASGQTQRYTLINFQMVDLETGEIVWENEYDFSKVAADNVIYR